MEFMKRVINPFRWFRNTGNSKKCVVLTPEERLSLTLRPYQSYLYKLQELLLWKDPHNSFTFVAVINVLFLVVYVMKWRFYSALFSLLAALAIYECWTQYVWPEIRLQDAVEEKPEPSPPCEGALSVPEVSRVVALCQSYSAEVLRRLKLFRQNYPGLFCSIGCTLCAAMARFGCIVPGIALLYCGIMITILGPGIIIHCISPETKKYLCDALSRIASVVRPPDTAPCMEEYMPDTSKENLKLLNLASGSEQQTAGSTPEVEVLSPEGPIPQYDESSMEVDSFALDSEPPELQFRPSHFNGASTALGMALSKALVDSLGTSLVSSQVIQSQEDSDSSDFELIDPEDS